MNYVDGGVSAAASARVMTTAQVAAYLQVSKSYLDKARADDRGPRFFNIGRAIRYRREEVDSWARRQERRNDPWGGRA